MDHPSEEICGRKVYVNPRGLVTGEHNVVILNGIGCVVRGIGAIVLGGTGNSLTGMYCLGYGDKFNVSGMLCRGEGDACAINGMNIIWRGARCRESGMLNHVSTSPARHMEYTLDTIRILPPPLKYVERGGSVTLTGPGYSSDYTPFVSVKIEPIEAPPAPLRAIEHVRTSATIKTEPIQAPPLRAIEHVPTKKELGKRQKEDSNEGTSKRAKNAPTIPLPTEWKSEPVSAMAGRPLCMVCGKRGVCAFLKPCDHASVCNKCARELCSSPEPVCPKCRIGVSAVHNAYA